MSLQVLSPSFVEGGEIPARFTCEGDDVSPELVWTDPPAETKSFVLIVDDPDAPDPHAPKMTWVHWVLFNLPSSQSGLPEGVPSASLPVGTGQGLNDWTRTGYGGPCPPIGRHRYYFKLYALDTTLALHQPTKSAVEQAMVGHVLDHAVLMGTYLKQGKRRRSTTP